MPDSRDLLNLTEPSEDTRKEIRALGYKTVDLIVDYIYEHALKRAFSGVTPKELDEIFEEDLPASGVPWEKILDECKHKVIAHSSHALHPRQLGLFTSSPPVITVFADAVATVLNQALDTWRTSPAATHVEKQLIRWLCNLVGYGPGSFGNFVSGGTLANLTGLKIARDAKGDANIRSHGLKAQTRRMICYASTETHFSTEKALDVLGLGRDALHKIPVDRNQRMNTAELRAAIQSDLASERGKPFCVVAMVGTTSSGTIDPLPEISEICRSYGLWMHVDAAYGGGALLSKTARSLLKGIGNADSVTIDPHKWFFQPYGIGAILVKDRKYLERSFEMTPKYLEEIPSSEGERLDFYKLGIEGSKRFRGLKFWMSLKHLGASRLGEIIDRNIELAKQLDKMVQESPDFESCGSEIDLSVCCFRYLPRFLLEALSKSSDESKLDMLQLKLSRALENSGHGVVSTTVVNRKTYLRTAFLNYLTRRDDLQFLLQRLRELGEPLAKEIFGT